MTAFHGNPQLKERLLQRARMINQQFSDGLRTMPEGQYAWQVRQHVMPLIPPVVRENDNNIGVRYAAREEFGAELGIPARIAFAQLALFESMHESVSPGWPLKFAKAVPVGADLSTVWRDFALFVLGDPQVGLGLYTQTGEQARAVSGIITLFDQSSDDAEAWKQAAGEAMSASHTSHSNGHGTNARECLESVGSAAALSAAYFAYAHEDAGAAKDAVSWAAWPLRHLAEHHYYVRGERFKPNVDDRGMVNVGEALWAAGQNARDLRQASHLGEEHRWARYELYGNKLLALIKARKPRSPGLLGRLFSSRLFGYN